MNEESFKFYQCDNCAKAERWFGKKEGGNEVEPIIFAQTQTHTLANAHSPMYAAYNKQAKCVLCIYGHREALNIFEYIT